MGSHSLVGYRVAYLKIIFYVVIQIILAAHKDYGNLAAFNLNPV
jgi:hypothetical protein